MFLNENVFLIIKLKEFYAHLLTIGPLNKTIIMNN